MINSCAAIIIAAKHGELIKVKDASGITHTVGTLRCKFEFRTNDWDYTTRTAVFCKGNMATQPSVVDTAIGVLLDNVDECAVPPEVLLPDEKYFSVGVWGVTKEGLRIVSKWLVFRIEDGCYVDSSESVMPTPTVYEQIVAKINERALKEHDHDDKYCSKEYVDEKLENIEVNGGGVTKVSQLENDAGYISSIPDEYVTDDELKSKGYLTEHQSLEGYAKKTDIPDLSGLEKKTDDLDTNKLDKSALDDAIDEALAQAKASGEFNGKDGYTPQKGIDYFDGKDGDKGEPFTYEDFTEEQLLMLQGPEGSVGPQGDPGYTPQKGIDYFTKEDIKSLGIEDIQDHLQKVDENINTIGYEKADVFYVDEQAARLNSLKYYGNADIVPSDASLFEFVTDDNTMTATIIRPSDRDYVTIEGDIVIPYEYYDVVKDKVYKVTGLELNFYFASGSWFLPNTLKKIYYLIDCSLKEIVIPDGVEEISSDAFSSNFELHTITFPSSLRSIGEYAFPDEPINTIYFKGTKAQWESVNIGEGNDSLANAKIYYEWDDGSGGSIIVDQYLDEASENAVANKVVAYNISNMQDDIRSQIENIDMIAKEIFGIRQQINQHAHFKGYKATNAEILEIEATPNDFAYSAESGTKWIYNEENGWQDSGSPVPDQLTPASDTTPLMNGEASVGTENAYARGDHRHPSDPSKVDKTEFNALKSDISNALDAIIAIQESLIGGDSV